MGRYDNPRICDEANLRSVAEVLTHPSIEVHHDAFASVDERVDTGDLVYLDPPYVPMSSTARFTSYTSGSFSTDDQRRLQQLVVRLASRGCWVVLSNSTAPLVTALYATREARRSGLRRHRVSAKRAINSNAGRRGKVQEYVITNVAPVPTARK